MSAHAVPYRRPYLRAAVLVPLLLVAVIAWWATRSDSEAAAPVAAGTSQAGKVAFDSLPGSIVTTLPVRSFSAGGANAASPTGGGGGSGKFVADDPVLTIDAADVDPLLLRVATTGVHLKTATVTLFRPGTTSRQEVWRFDDVTVSALHTSQSGSAKPPRVSLVLRYTKVTVTSYDAGGTAASSFCFNLAASTVC